MFSYDVRVFENLPCCGYIVFKNTPRNFPEHFRKTFVSVMLRICGCRFNEEERPAKRIILHALIHEQSMGVATTSVKRGLTKITLAII